MYQKWSNSRTGSRPTTSGIGFLSSRLPTFQPPSYYAAAAGLSPRTDPSSSKVQPHAEELAQPYNPPTGGPLSYPTAQADADNAESGEPSGRRKRSLSRSLSRATPKGQKELDARIREGSSKRQMAEIPFLETQLLPSLRDTIDRMTHPPPRGPAQDDEPRKRDDSEQSDTSAAIQEDKARTLVVSSQENRSFRSPVIASGYVSTHASTSRGQASSTPTTPAAAAVLSPHSLGTPSLNTNRSDQPLSPRVASKIPASPRIPTKPSLRPGQSAGTHLSMSSHSPLLSSAVDQSSGIPSRFMKRADAHAEIGRTSRIPMTSKIRSPNLQAGMPSGPSSASSSSSRTRTHSGTAISPDAVRDSTPRSNLPRSNVDSGSELEREYNRRIASGRLVVTNAEVTPSSESEHEEPAARNPPRTRAASSNGRTPGRTPRTPREPVYNHSPRIPQHIPGPSSQTASKDRRKSRYAPAVGLGLRDYPEFERAEASTGSITEDDEGNIYESSRTHDREPDAYNNDQHHIDEDDHSSHEDLGDNRRDTVRQGRRQPSSWAEHRQSYVIQPSDSRRRREQALIGLVDGLQFDSTTGARTITHQESGRDERRRSRERRREDRHQRYGEESEDRDAHAQEVQLDRRAKDSERKRTVTQPSRLPMSSRAREDPSSSSRQDQGRSTSLPPKSRRSSKTDNVPSSSRYIYQEEGDHADERTYEAPPKKARHRTSASTSTGDGRRHSVVENPELERPSNRRRSSTYAADTQATHNVRLQGKRGDTATLERERFGIPESLSYTGYTPRTGGEEASHGHNRRDSLEHQDDYSLPEEDLRLATARSTPDLDHWDQPGVSGFSTAAQALLTEVTGGPCAREGEQSMAQDKKARRRSKESRQPIKHSRSRSNQHVPAARPESRHSRALSASSSAPSVYESEVEPEPEPAPEPESSLPDEPYDQLASSWRATLRPADYDALSRAHGKTEMARQELIYHYVRAHSDFVLRLRSLVRIFIVPLRRKHSKVWLPGVPKEVARLFDWLEDIVNLHGNIADALAAATEPWRSGNIVEGFGRAMRSFVPRFEVYQPYLVRVDGARQLLMDSVAVGDEFGEFLRLREAHPECGGHPLSDLLLEPVDHLYGSVDLFKELSRLTPPSHLDHLLSLSLYQSMRMIVHVLGEVKLREEEYDFVKSIASRIEGFLPSVQLARRERRLLWHGEVVYRPYVQVKNDRNDRRNSSSRSTATVAPANFCPRPGQHRTPTIVVSPCPDSPALDGSKRSSKALGKRSERDQATESIAVRAYVFTDVLLLTGTAHRVDEDGQEKLKLLLDIGIAKILDVSAEVGNESMSEAPAVRLTLLPLGQSDLQTGTIPEGSIATSVTLALPTTPEDSENALQALRRCQAYTLCSLSFPSHSGAYLPHGPFVDLEADTQRSVMDILHAGLPLPKSPSLQLRDNQKLGVDASRLTNGKDGNDADREREERGWWTLRFQQVLREVQRRDPVLSLSVFSD